MFDASPTHEASHRPDYRDNTRAMFNSPEFAAALWARVAPHVPWLATFEATERSAGQSCLGWDTVGHWDCTGVSPYVRVCRYTPGGHFAPHCDGTLRLGDNAMSVYTIMAYLNGQPAFTGGEVEETGVQIRPWVVTNFSSFLRLLFRRRFCARTPSWRTMEHGSVPKTAPTT